MNRWIDNKRWAGQKLKNGWHTIVLMTSMLLLCIIIGWLFAGMTGMVGVLIATASSLLIAPGLSSRFMMRWFKAKPLTPIEAPSLFTQLRELVRRAGLNHMPSLYYLPIPLPGIASSD